MCVWAAWWRQADSSERSVQGLSPARMFVAALHLAHQTNHAEQPDAQHGGTSGSGGGGKLEVVAVSGGPDVAGESVMLKLHTS